MWDKGRRSEAQRKRRIAAKSQCADAVQQGGGGWRILTAIVTTVRSAKAVITTFCRMLSCENRGHSRIRTKMHLNCVKLEGNSASHQTGTALAAHVPVPHSKVSAVFPGDGEVVVGGRGGSLGWRCTPLWRWSEGRSHVQAALRRLHTAQLFLHRPPPSSLPITSPHRCPQAHFASTFLC